MSESFSLSETERMLAGIVRFGVITELDEASARVKVRTGGLSTDWLPWLTTRAGATRTWSAPRPGEQVLVLAPCGDPSQGVVLLSVYQDDYPAPAASKDKETTVYPDGSTVEYDSAANLLTVTVSGNGRVVVNCKEVTVNAETSVTLNTPQTTCKGKLTVEGLLTYQAGMAGSGGSGAAASIVGDISVTGGNVTADGIGLKTHKHPTAPTGPQSQPVP